MRDDGLRVPRRLERSDTTEAFRSGADDLDDWLARLAWQNQRSRDTVTYVTTQDGVILGYYAIAMASYARGEAPGGLGHRSRPAQIPCVLLARLAVDRRAQGRGLGAALLRDAIERSYRLSEVVGAAALLVHCRDEAARAFYLANGDFLASPADPMHLLLPMKQARRVPGG